LDNEKFLFFLVTNKKNENATIRNLKIDT